MLRRKRPLREAPIRRETKEVRIKGRLCLDGEGKTQLSTGIKFLDHMLTLFAFHGFFDLNIDAAGDLSHHTIEDVAIVLGDSFKQALGEGVGIRRYGAAEVPMDEVLAKVAVDISGRSSLTMPGEDEIGFRFEPVDDFTLEDAIGFLDTFSKRARATIKVDYKCGRDLHHLLEAVFKALGIALDQATQIDPRRKGVPSTKDTLDL